MTGCSLIGPVWRPVLTKEESGEPSSPKRILPRSACENAEAIQRLAGLANVSPVVADYAHSPGAHAFSYELYIGYEAEIGK